LTAAEFGAVRFAAEKAEDRKGHGSNRGDEGERGLFLARDSSTIGLGEVLESVRGGGPGMMPSDARVAAMLERLHQGERETLGGFTVRDLIERTASAATAAPSSGAAPERAAEQGYVEAQARLATRFLRGFGRVSDQEQGAVAVVPTGTATLCAGVQAGEPDIAKAAGTPAYVYSSQIILDNYRAYDEAFGDVSHMVCYAVKANSSLGVLSLLAKAGSGFDIVSAGELFRVIEAGGDPKRVVFSGVGKTAAEVEYALGKGIHSFNCESEAELHLISRVAVSVATSPRRSRRFSAARARSRSSTTTTRAATRSTRS